MCYSFGRFFVFFLGLWASSSWCLLGRLLWKISRRHSWPKNVMGCQSSLSSCVGGGFSYSPAAGGTNGMAPVLHSTKRPWVLESWGWFQQKLLRHGIWNKAVNLCSKFLFSYASRAFFVTNAENALITFFQTNILFTTHFEIKVSKGDSKSINGHSQHWTIFIFPRTISCFLACLDQRL